MSILLSQSTKQKKVSLSEKYLFRSEVIATWIKNNRNLTITNLAKKLRVSRAHVYRLMKRYDQGELKPLKKRSNNFIKESIKDEVINKLVEFINMLNHREDARNYTPTFKFAYIYLDLEKFMSYSTFVNVAKSRLLYMKSCHHKTKKLIRWQIKQKQAAEQRRKHNLVEDTLIDYDKKDKVPLLKVKKGFYGSVNEIDASEHDWFNNGQKYHLYHIVDAQTGTLLDLHMEEQETGIGYWTLLSSSFQKHGIPKTIKSDKRKCFWNNQEANSAIARMIKSFEIEIQVSSNPMSKPNVERSFLNAQRFFIDWFLIDKVADCETVNKNKEHYIAKYNTYYHKNKANHNVFRHVSKTEIVEKMKFNVIRKVQKGNYLALDNKKYIPINKNNKRFILPEHSQMNIFYSPIDKYHVYQNGVKLYLKDLNETEFNQLMQDHYQKKAEQFTARKQKSYNHQMHQTVEKLKYQKEYWYQKYRQLEKELLK